MIISIFEENDKNKCIEKTFKKTKVHTLMGLRFKLSECNMVEYNPSSTTRCGKFRYLYV